MMRPLRSLIFAAAVGVVFVASDARAEDIGADEVARRTLEHDTFGFEGTRMRARLVLSDADGNAQERAFDAISKKNDAGLIKSVVRFSSPANVAGTAFLMLQHDGGPDEQYIYLSRMKSTRRIGGTGERDGSFMGSDFSYADLERKDLRDATYSLLGEEAIGKDDCYELQAVPRAPSTYSRVVLWIRQRDFIPLRIQWFAQDGQLEKTMFTRRVGTASGRSMVTESRTENARTHHTTDFIIDDVELADVDDAEFTPAALSH
jgi:hypothetical protein